ncbi:MAG TPA: ATP-binding protein, partial [Cystobacter sp.]
AFPSFLAEPERRTLGAVLDDYLRALADEEALLVRLQTQAAAEAEATLRQLLDSPASSEAERLITTYLQLYEGALARAERFRIILFAFSLVLVAFVLAVLVRLARTGAALDALNAQLEARVEERTAALSTANAELRESEARKAAILESALDGIISLDEAGRILEFNPAAEHIFRLPRARALGRDFLSLALAATVNAEQRGMVARALRAEASPGRATRLELQGLRADGGTFPAELTLLRVRSDGPARFTSYVRDITDRKEVERLKNEFVSTVSHELRTPLTSIRGSLGLLEGGILGELPSQAQDMVRIARTNTERLIRLINDILDLEKMESGKLDFQLEPLELGALLAQAVEAHQGYAQECGARVELAQEAPGARALVDGDRLLQVLANLLSNALKFSPRGERVTLRLERVGSWLRVSVEDHGPGIPESFRARIFEKFAQADGSDSRRKGGTGLGLSIARALVTQLGGTLDFVSREGAGTTFRVELPEWHAPATPLDLPVPHWERTAVEPRPGAVRPRLLHLEADEDNRRVVADVLRDVADVVPARGLAEAESALRAEPFPLIIAENVLPDGGLLPLEPLLAAAPVVLFSVREAEPELARRVSAVLVKSRATNEELRAAVLRLLRASSLRSPSPPPSDSH